MKARFKRKIKVESFIVFANIEIEKERDDIKQYLEESLTRNDKKNVNIQSYLRTIGLIDDTNNLTAKGEQVKNTGHFASAESGKYQIWVVKNDELVDDYILGMERKKVHDDSRKLLGIHLKNIRNEYFNLHFREYRNRDKSLSINEKLVKIKDLGRSNPVIGIRTNDEKTVLLAWEFDDNKQELSLAGDLFKTQIKQKLEEKNISLSELLSEILPSEWDSSQQRLKVELDGLNHKAVEKFILPQHSLDIKRGNYGPFPEAVLHQIPIMPASDNIAASWLSRLIEMEATEKYLLPEEFEYKIEKLSQRNPLDVFKLSPPDIEEVMQETKRTNSAAFWNLAAPNDLNPFSKAQEKQNKIFTLLPGVKYTFESIVFKLMPQKTILQLIIVDRYVERANHQQSFEALVKGVREAQNEEVPTTLYTLARSKNDYIPELTNISVKDFSKIGHLDHDRFLLFRLENEDWLIWTVTRSVDYLKFPKNTSMDFQTEGICEDSVTFSRVSMRALSSKLSNSIQQEIQNLHQV